MEFITELYKTEYAILAWIVTAFLAVVAFLTMLKSGHEFIAWFRTIKADNPEKVDFSKRSAIKALGGITLLSLIWVNGRKIYTDYKNSQKVIKVSEKSGLIAHKKTGTIHLARVSNGALPSTKWATKSIDLIRYTPYRGYELRIYEEIAREAEKQRNDEVIIYSYLLAIKSSPLSYHLYDKLTRIYGRRGEYQHILDLHKSALNNLSAMNLSKKRLKRATKEFAMRVDRTKKRALLS